MDSTYKRVLIAGCCMVMAMLGFPERGFASMYQSVQLSFTLIHDYNTNSVSDPYDDDNDNDGIADLWEIDTFGNLTTATATSDFDHDSFTDLQEYRAGSDARDPYSHLQIEFAQFSRDGRLTLWWESSEQFIPFPRTYDLQCVDALPGFSGEPITLITNIPSEGISTAVALFQQGAAPNRQRFYRVKLHER